jgi:molybdopterin molybdotransferase
MMASHRSARLSVSEGLACIGANTPRLEAETVPIGAALWRVAIDRVHARLDVPRFACSAMDGYAVRAGETHRATAEHPAIFPFARPLAAGGIPSLFTPGNATPISTGAPVPLGADAVVAREKGFLDDAVPPALRLCEPVPAGHNIRMPGEDIRTSSVVLKAGERITPEMIGLLSAAGVADLAVMKRPRLTYFSTGDEVAPPGMLPSGAFAIPDANRPMIAAFAQEAGLAFRDLGHAGDTSPDITAHILAAAQDADVILSSGGVSGGAFDLVRACVEAQGGEILFHGLEMRPGKPLLFARLPSGALYFGLPGNPVAALVGFRFFVLAAIRAALGLPEEVGEDIPSLSNEAANPARGPTRFLRVRLRDDADGPTYDTDLDQRSHILSSTILAEAWLRIDGDSGRAQLFRKRIGPLT